MSQEWWLAVAGGGGAFLTTIAFVPQIVRIWRKGGRDLSYGLLLLYLVGVLLWLVYGLLIGARIVILGNLAASALVAFATGLKWALERKPVPTSSRRLRVAIDMDEVLADTLSKHLRLYNQTFGTSIAPQDLRGRSLTACLPREGLEAIREFVTEASFFRDLDVMPGSREVVRELMERYEVFVASAAMEVPTSFGAKYSWLREHFPFIPPSHIVFCGDKAVLDVDYLVDDTVRHFERFRGTPILFGAPHNSGEQRFLRAEGWADVKRLLLDGDRGSAPLVSSVETVSSVSPPLTVGNREIAGEAPRVS